ncbi:MAG: selenoprotein [Gemmatimonadetes bacterium]|nr:selenoprotein [Gemmatimonadota bacterium]HCK09922.1 selenoprotein [Candidatus Latescibacterota bacterium]
MTDQILKTFKQDVEAFTLIPSSGGRFEVTLDGELIYSKIQEKRFPEYGEIEPHLKNKVS